MDKSAKAASFTLVLFLVFSAKAKPSVMRISEDETGINTSQNTLSNPAVTAANNRVNEFNENAVKTDIENWHKAIEFQLGDFWNSSERYKEIVDKVYRLEQLENELKEAGILKYPFREEIS